MADAKRIRFNDGSIANFKDETARGQIENIQTQVNNMQNQVENISNVINSGGVSGSGGPATFEIRTTDPANPTPGQAWIITS